MPPIILEAFKDYQDLLNKQYQYGILLTDEEKYLIFWSIYYNITKANLMIFAVSSCPLERACAKLYYTKPLGNPIFEGDLTLSKIRSQLISSTLPDNLFVKGNLTMNSNLTSLPQGLKVSGRLHLNHYVKEIPKGTVIGGDLWIADTNIKSIEGVKIKGVLYCSKPIKAPSSIFQIQV